MGKLRTTEVLVRVILGSPGAGEVFGAWRRNELEIHPMRRDLRRQSAGQFVHLIDQLAADVAAEENELRQVLIGLLETDEKDRALSVLKDWQHMAPGEVLKRYSQTADDQD